MKKNGNQQFLSNLVLAFVLVVAGVMMFIAVCHNHAMASTPDIPTITTTQSNPKNNLKTYYCVGEGDQERMLTGWISIDNEWHFFDRKTGEMVVNSWMHDESRGGECFFDENGAMQLGWVIIDGNQYYFSLEEEDYGNAVTGTRTIDGKEYCFGSDGVLIQ